MSPPAFQRLQTCETAVQLKGLLRLLSRLPPRLLAAMPHLPWCGRFTECLVTLLVTRSNLTFETWCPVERFMRSCAEEMGARRTCDKVPASCASAVMACGAREEEKSLNIECVHRGSPAGKCLVSSCRQYSYNALNGAGRDSDG